MEYQHVNGASDDGTNLPGAMPSDHTPAAPSPEPETQQNLTTRLRFAERGVEIGSPDMRDEVNAPVQKECM